MKTKIALGIVVLLILIQFIPVKKNLDTDNTYDIIGYYNLSASSEIRNILITSCYDCHSNNTVYPWYNNIAPVSWYLANHVREAKEHLNFSEWKYLDEAKKAHKIEECIEVLVSEEMPMTSYTLIHQEASLSASQRETLITFFESL